MEILLGCAAVVGLMYWLKFPSDKKEKEPRGKMGSFAMEILHTTPSKLWEMRLEYRTSDENIERSCLLTLALKTLEEEKILSQMHFLQLDPERVVMQRKRGEMIDRVTLFDDCVYVQELMPHGDFVGCISQCIGPADIERKLPGIFRNLEKRRNQ
jgi:hypothetical protein